MKRLFFIFLAIFTIGLMTTSCTKDDDKTEPSFYYTNSAGAYVLCEGQFSTGNGTIVYYDKDGVEYRKVFEESNDGLEIGNIVQDMFIVNDRVYFLSQKGNANKGVNHLVVCDAETMKMIYSSPLNIKTPEDIAAYPQHLVVVNETQAYIQYADVNYEATSGICKLTLAGNSVTVGPTIEGTFGKYSVDGAIKARMILSKGKIYAGAGNKIIIINPASDTQVEKTISFEEGRQIKNIVKAADNNLYAAISGNYTIDPADPWGPPIFSTDPKIVSINHSGEIIHQQELEGITFPVTGSSSVKMTASFNLPHLYFVDSYDYSAKTASRYNYETKSLEKNYITTPNTIYGVMGVHPTTNQLWVSTTDYATSTVFTYDVTGSTPNQIKKNDYELGTMASPAGVYFPYGFTTEYLNR